MPPVKPLARKNDIVVQEFESELLVYDLKKNKAFALNETSSLIWQLCDGTKTINEISVQTSVILKNFVSEDFVWVAIENFKKEKLIVSEANYKTPFEGLSRREIIRKIGLTSMAVLPLISAISSPLAIHAQSGCTTGASGRALGCPCTAISQCAPPSSRCCLSSAGAPGNQTCVPGGTQIPVGGVCGNNCSCNGSCCSGGLCVTPGSVGLGGFCSVNCACSTGLSCITSTCCPTVGGCP